MRRRKASSRLRCYDIIGFVALHLSRRHDLLNLIASRKTRKCQDFVGVSLFLLELRLSPCKLKGIKFIRHVLTRGLKSCDTFIQNGRGAGLSSTEIFDEDVLVIWTKRLWEFGKLHVDIGLTAGPQIASTNLFDNIQPQAPALSPSHASSMLKRLKSSKSNNLKLDSRYHNNSDGMSIVTKITIID